MPQNETTLFKHILICFLTVTALSAIIILIHNFLPTFTLLKLLFLMDRELNIYGYDHVYLYVEKALRSLEIFQNINTMFVFINTNMTNAFAILFSRGCNNLTITLKK